MTKQENQIIDRMANFILSKAKYRKGAVVPYNDVTREINIPSTIVKAAAKQVCNWLLTFPIVDDIDIIDDNCFDVMLKGKSLRS